MLPMWNGDYTQKFTHSFEIQPFFSNGVGAWREEDVFSLAKLESGVQDWSLPEGKLILLSFAYARP